MLIYPSLFYLKPANAIKKTYKCLWCDKEVRKSGSSCFNLKTHRDGSRQDGRTSHGCRNCQKAIDAGAKFPPTALEEEKLKKLGLNTITNHFSVMEKFDNGVLNQIITLWLLQQAIPWKRVEDPYLQAAFNYCQPGSNIFKRRWSATSARAVYLDLQAAMLLRLKVRNPIKSLASILLILLF